ncbi:MAG: type I-E CRISPR-associated protein Cas7/Cse4/CasC [Caldilineaceae bacterium]|nr:type I-E CRISPR-associated protein Cas7/Cse4/CasC [Caldilineaceae bacterium]
MLIQIHILQNYAPSNLNRDDSGAPKSAYFGGIKRGRISSQCLKRSMRHSESFKSAFKQAGRLAERTKLLPQLIDEELRKLGTDDEVRKIITERIPEIGKKGNDKSEDDEAVDSSEQEGEVETRQLIFLHVDAEVPALAKKLVDLVAESGKDKFMKMKIADLEKALQHELPRSVDIAMFGRMTTSAAFEDVQASVQVAHSLTTSAVETEFDYFTAVDDISGQTGAGMIGDVEFNSATHYKYLNIHWEELVKNLGGDKAIAQDAVLALLEAAAQAQPSGKQNSFAAFNLPDFILVEIGEKNLPISYANAFTKPVRETHSQSLLDSSVMVLNDYMNRLRKAYAITTQRSYLAVFDHTIDEAEKNDSLPQLQEWVANQLPA